MNCRHYSIVVSMIFFFSMLMPHAQALDCQDLSVPIQVSGASENIYDPDVAVDDAGNSHICWRSQSRQLWYAVVGAEGTVIGGPTQLGNEIRYPKIAVEPDGTAHIVAQSSANPPGAVGYYIVSGNGSSVLANSFQPLGSLQYHDAEYWFPSVAYDPINDRAVVAVEAYVSPDEFNYLGDPNERYWNRIICIAMNPTDGEPIINTRWYPYDYTSSSTLTKICRFPDVAIDTQGGIHVVWEHNDPEWSSSEYNCAYSNDDMGAWMEVGGSRDMYHLQGGPEMAADDSGNVHVVWADDSGGVQYAEIDHGGNILGVFDGSKSSSSALRPNVAAGGGKAVSVWQDGTTVYALNLKDGSATDMEVACNASIPAADVLPSGELVFAFRSDRTGSTLCYAIRSGIEQATPTPGTPTETPTPGLPTMTPTPTPTGLGAFSGTVYRVCRFNR